MGVMKRTLLVCGLMSNLMLIGGQVVSPEKSQVSHVGEEKVEFKILENSFRKNDVLRTHIPVDRKDLELLVGGNMKIDSYNVRNCLKLTRGVDDQVNQFRHRFELGVQTNLGKDSHDGKAVVESRVSFGGTLFWRTLMTKKSEPLEATNPQDSINAPLQLFVNEAWFNLNLETLTNYLNATPHSIKAGFFPFVVGRGLSLGERACGGVTYMGFPRQGVQTYLPKYAPGILLHGELPTNNLSYDLYYSPMVAENLTRWVQDVGRTQYIIDRDTKNAHGRHLAAASLTYLLEPVKNANVRLEPYLVYYNSQRQNIGSPADAPLKFTTFGLMTDAVVGPVRCNFEIATQTGSQEVLPFMNVIQGDPVTNEFHPGYKIQLSGSMFVFDAAYTIKDVPFVPTLALGYFSGGEYPYNDTVGQFHAGEGGFATLLQAQQATDGQKNKKFKGFLPLRDWGYRGMWCNPLIMFNAGVIPRPVDVDVATLQASNDQDTATNLMFVGFGGTWHPLENRKTLSISNAMFFHWEAHAPHAWSKTQLQPGQVGDTVSSLSSGSVRNNAPGYNISGWYTSKLASSFLGTEINMVVDYKVAQDVNLSIRGAVFFPGQLYADLAGQPNINATALKDTFTYASSGVPVLTTVVENPGLGHSPAYGLYTRIQYVF